MSLSLLAYFLALANGFNYSLDLFDEPIIRGEGFNIYDRINCMREYDK